MLAVAAALAALGAGVGWKLAGTGAAHPLPWRDVSPRLAGIRLPYSVFRVFISDVAFADFQREADPGIRPRSPGVDFDRRELVLVSPGPRSSSGYGVRVLAVVERRRSILVRVRELTPSLGEPVRVGVTAPYRLLEIARSDKPVQIDWEGQ